MFGQTRRSGPLWRLWREAISPLFHVKILFRFISGSSLFAIICTLCGASLLLGVLGSISIKRHRKRTDDPKKDLGPVGCLVHLLLKRAYIVWNVSSHTINLQSARKAAEITMARSIGERVLASESRGSRSSFFKCTSSSLKVPS